MKSILIWLVFIAFAFPQEATSQSNFLIDSLKVLEGLKSKDLESYFHKIVELGKQAYENSDVSGIVVLGNYLDNDFGQLSSKERLTLRSAAMRLANFHFKLEGYNADVLRLYLLAHENVSNKIHLDSLSWYIENELCIIYTINGDYEKADYFGDLLERSLRKYGMLEKVSRFYTNKGRLLKSAYKTTEAIESFKKGYNYADSIHFIGGRLSNALNLAELFNAYPSLGDPEPYLLITSKLLPEYKAEKSFAEKKSSFEIEYGQFLIAKGDSQKGLVHLDSALQYMSAYYANKRRREFSKYYLVVAEVYFSIDSLDASLKAIYNGIASLMPEYNDEDEALKPSQLYVDNSISELYELKARVYAAKFSKTKNPLYLEQALLCLELGLVVNDKMRDFIVADPSKLVSIRTNKAMVTYAIEILHQLFSLDANPEYLAKARALFNRSKSILYSEKIHHAHLAGLLKPLEKGKLKSLQRRLLMLHDQKLEKDADLTSLNGQILLLYEKIDSIYIPYQSMTMDVQVPENYIEYVVDDRNIFALSETEGVLQFLRIGDTPYFLSLLERLEEFITLKDLSMDEEILHDLFLFLVRPLGDRLPAHVVLIADGPVGYIPFEMLKDEDDDYIINHSTISYSFEYNRIAPYKINRTYADNFIYCLSPAYPSKATGNNLQITRGGLYHLPFAKQEIDTISKLFGQYAMVSQSPLKEDWMQHIQASNIFHYAGHAIINAEKAYLALSADDIISNQLTSTEITLLHLPLDLVVLSACETGLGKLEFGEGIRSLGRGFMEAGTKSTIISLWNVNDKSTASIMTSFYRYLKMGHKKDDALRQAKLDYLENTTSRTLHPFYWAAFIPAGDMTSL